MKQCCYEKGVRVAHKDPPAGTNQGTNKGSKLNFSCMLQAILQEYIIRGVVGKDSLAEHMQHNPRGSCDLLHAGFEAQTLNGTAITGPPEQNKAEPPPLSPP